MWLVLSTSGLLVLLNSGIGILALRNHRTGLRVTERLIASGDVDVYHAKWLTGYGYRESWARERAGDAARLALQALPASGLAYAETEEGLVPAPDATDQAGATPPQHPLTLAAWRFTRDTWAAGNPVTVKALTAHPRSGGPARPTGNGSPLCCPRTAPAATTTRSARRGTRD